MADRIKNLSVFCLIFLLGRGIGKRNVTFREIEHYTWKKCLSLWRKLKIDKHEKDY